MLKAIGKIVKSNTHVDYVCRVYNAGEVHPLPEPSEYSFGTFVSIQLEENGAPGGELIGVIYNTLLLNPDFGNLGPRLSPRQDTEIFSPDYLSETATLVGIIAVVGIITLRNQDAGASEGTLAYTLAALKDWTFLLGPGWVVGWGNGLILGYMMYRSRLVPRPWPWLGMIGGPLLAIVGTIILFGGNDPSSGLHSLQGLVTIPEAAWELFLGIYCTFKGFRPSSPILQPAARQDRAPAVPGVAPA